MSFADLHLSDELLRAVTESGYDTPTPIQREAIPNVLMGRDLIGIAQTGTGKTAAFVLPMIDILGEGQGRARMPRSLILEPTRELAMQVSENFEKYGKYHKLSMALLIGGTNMADQIKKLEKGVDVLIATPGRLMDLFGRGKIMLNRCGLLVIDEADRMLDMGFIPDIEEICSKLPKERQTLLFSATMPAPIKKLSDKFLSNPKQIEVARPATANISIDQRMLRVTAAKKKDALADLLRREEVKTAIVFCNRKTTVRELTTSLKRRHLKAGQIHGDMEQADRIKELDRFKSEEINILVASDVAARGLDIKGVSHVLNFDVPWQPDDYVHRIGRTGRAGRTGTAITLVTKDDAEAIDKIEKLIGTRIALLDGHSDAAPEASEGEPEAKKAKPARRERAARSPRREESPREELPAAETQAPEEPAEEVSSPVERPAEKPRREARRREPARREPARGEPQRREPARGNDEEAGWNGPVPNFLAQGFGS
ncbi:MAG: box helicase [Alphaproteobacteria bacterium]|nr:box helicase [Alphaproteobacteria bacterium]